MSQNNGGLNWDQVQAPNFSGISQAQIAAAKMLDDAIGQGNKLNLAIGQGRSDEQEKNLLLNLSQYGKGEDALAAMNSGSLLDGINVKALTAEALRNLQKDIGGLYDLENKGIQNTQGYLNHDLTKANTGNVKANTASTYQSMKQSADTHRNTQNQREYENWYARNTNGMNSQQIEEFNRSDANTNAIQQFGVGFNTVNNANNMLNNRVNTQGNLHLGTKLEDEVEGYNIAKRVNESFDSMVAGSASSVELTKLVNDAIAQEKDPQAKKVMISLAKERGIDTSYTEPIDDLALLRIPTGPSKIFNEEPAGPPDIYTDTLGAVEKEQQQPKANFRDSVLYTGQEQNSNLLDAMLNQVNSANTANAAPKSNVVNYAEEVKSNNVTISSDPKEVLSREYAASLDGAIKELSGAVDHEDSGDYSIDDIVKSASKANPNLTLADFNDTRSMNSNLFMPSSNKHGTPPISYKDSQRISASIGKDITKLPLTAENLAMFERELKKLNTAPDSEEGRKREKTNERLIKEAETKVEEKSREYLDHYAQEAKSLGLTDEQVAQYAYTNARLRAANELLEAKNAGNLKGAEGVEQTIAKLGNWHANISARPTQFTQQLANEISHSLSPAMARAMGPSYYSETILEGVSNERTSVAEALIKNNPSADLKYKNVESDLKNIMYLDGVKVDAITAGYLLAANGMKYDPEQIKEIYKASNNVTNSATITELNLDKAEIDGLIKLSGELAVAKSKFSNSKLSDVDRENRIKSVDEGLLRTLEELHFRQQAFIDKYNNLKGE